MSLPWDDPNADPLADMRALRDRPVPPPGQPVLVPRRLKELLAGHIPDNHLVAYPEPVSGYMILPEPGEAEQVAVTGVEPVDLPWNLHRCASEQCTYLVAGSALYCCGPVRYGVGGEPEVSASRPLRRMPAAAG